MLKIGVLVSGGGTNLQAIINQIENKNINAKIMSVVSNKENVGALTRAKNHGIDTKCIKVSDFDNSILYEQSLINHFRSLEVDLIVLAGFMIVLGEDFINAFQNKIINIHPSLIPSFCGKGFYGLKVHEAAIEKGVKITGATVHFVDSGTDTGKIILQKAVFVEENDTPQSLQKRVMEEAEWIIYPQAIKMFGENKIRS